MVNYLRKKTMRVEEIKIKDILAGIILIFCFILIGCGINHVVSGIVIMVTTYYFRKRSEDIKLDSNG